MPSEELDRYFASMFKPGAVILTSGFKGGGKSHTAIAVAEQLVKGLYPSVGRVEVFTNILFFHNVNGKIVEEAPEHVHIVTTMKELFPMLVDSIDSNGRDVLNLLILDEAQNFIGGDSNQTNASVMMKEMLGIIRKFRLAVWFLTPSAKSIGPAFRNWINHPDYPGNLTAMFKKDLEWNKRKIEEKGWDFDPRELMVVKNFDSRQRILRVPITEWTQTKNTIRSGQYCYDHEASATFYVGDGFDWELFNRTIGGVSSLRVLDTIREYYREHHEEDVEQRTMSPEEARKLTQGEIARRLLESGVSQRSVAKALGVTRETVLKRVGDIGYVPKNTSKFTPKKYRSDEGVVDQPHEGIASKVAGGPVKGSFLPPIYNSREPRSIEGVRDGSAATSDSSVDHDSGIVETPIPHGRYTMEELRRAVHHCIGDDDDETEE